MGTAIDASGMAAADIVAMFGMERHRVAGWFVLHYSNSELPGRSQLSSSYHLLAGDEPLTWQRVGGIEVWHHYRGAPAEMVVGDGGGLKEVSLLGSDLAAGQRPQLAVPAYFWRSCRSLGAWTLLGCTMSPGHSARAATILSADD